MKRFSLLLGLVVPASILVGACSSSSNDASSACSHYFSALETDRCGSNIHSDARRAELQKAFQDVCLKALAEPGITFGAGDLDKCASAYDARACGDPTPDACKFKSGSLADGSGCISDSQCSSGNCSDNGSGGGGGSGDGGTSGSKPSYCATCQPTVPVGGACGQGEQCADQSTCDSKTQKCVAVVKGKDGDPCDFSTKQCDTGLTCNLETMKCGARKGVGEACASSIDCQSSLACVATKCAAKVAEGGDCTSSDQCTPPLGCDPNSKKCAKHPLAAQGQPCDSFTLCDYGSCRFQSGSGTPNGTCPTIIPVGGACSKSSTSDTSQCDDFSSCIDGKCTIPDANLCK